MVAKVCALYHAYKLVVLVTLPSKHFLKTLNRETTLLKSCVFMKTCRSLINVKFKPL